MPAPLIFETNVFDPAKGPVPVRTLRKEFNVDAWKVFEETERDVVAFGKESNVLLLAEAIKKKKRLWWSLLWNRIKPW